jgi:hypothetical protein
VVQLTFTAVNKTFDGSASAQVVASISNLAVGDQVGVAQTAAFHDGRVGAGKVIDITQVQLAGVDAGNYALPATTWTTTGDIVVNGNTQGAGNAAGALQQSTASSGGSTPQAGGIPSAGVVVAGSASQSAAPLLSALMTGSPAYTTNTGGTVSSVLASGGTPVSGVYQNATGAATAGQTGTGAGNAALSSTGEPTPPTASGGDPVVGDANLGAMGSTSTRTGGGAVASSSMMTHAVGIANIATGAETGFTAFKPLGVLTVVAGQSASLLVGTDIFSHAGKPSTWRLVARQENGAPLPEWIRFDAQAGTFEVHAPEGLEVEVKVVVTAYDSQGNSATTGLTVKTGR